MLMKLVSVGEMPCLKAFSIKESNKEVICEIRNSNHPKTMEDKSGSGVGLEQVSRRLEILYPGDYTWSKGISKEGEVYESRLSIRI